MFLSTLEPPSTVPEILDEEAWQERLRRFYAARGEAQYWSFRFPRAWAKFQRGVRQELELADRVSRWIDLQGARVLVIGSYLGYEAIAYALRGAEVVGIDLDQPAQVLSRALAHQHGVTINVLSGDATHTPFPDAFFDYVSCSQVLEHLRPEQQPQLLREIWRVCRPGGLVWLDTPNQLALRDRHDTGLLFIHWLPRSIKVPLAKRLGRAVPGKDPAFGDKPVYLHYYVGYFGLQRMLSHLGPYAILSRYRGYADIDHYCDARRRQGRTGGWTFALKTALLRTFLHFWNWNWFSGIRLVIRKLPA